MRWLVIFLLLASPAVATQDFAADDVRLELALEDRQHPPHMGDMILLSIRGTFEVPVVREELRQPALISGRASQRVSTQAARL